MQAQLACALNRLSALEAEPPAALADRLADVQASANGVTQRCERLKQELAEAHRWAALSISRCSPASGICTQCGAAPQPGNNATGSPVMPQSSHRQSILYVFYSRWLSRGGCGLCSKVQSASANVARAEQEAAHCRARADADRAELAAVKSRLDEASRVAHFEQQVSWYSQFCCSHALC